MLKFEEYPKITAPFGMTDPNKVIPTTGRGFLEKQATPVYNGGTQITRHDLNGLGYMATVGAFLDRIGYPYGNVTNHLDIAYPKGAILTEVHGDEVREWVSLQDNNRQAPHTNYISEPNTTYESWRPLHKIKNYNFYPDYSRRENIASEEIFTKSYNFTVDMDESGWVLVTRTLRGWDEAEPLEKASTSSTVKIAGRNVYVAFSEDEFTINTYEGETASRLFPVSSNQLLLRGNLDIKIFPSMLVQVYKYPFEATE